MGIGSGVHVPEFHEGRVYVPFDAECHFCTDPAVWSVTLEGSDHPGDEMQVCDAHKYTAFS